MGNITRLFGAAVRSRLFRLVGFGWMIFFSMAQVVTAQDGVRISGQAYLDYYYRASSPDTALDGISGFTYRRAYLTADYAWSKTLDARVRLEASDATALSSRGTFAFVKDLYLRYRAPSGHALTAGITPPPVYTVSEEAWGYRSLERTIMDQVGVAASRDFGLRLDGPLLPGGNVRYAVMVANNNGVRPETDRFKRVYGQVHLRPARPLVLSFHADYAGYGRQGATADPRTSAATFSAFAGFVTDPLRFGAEGFYRATRYAADPATGDLGLSLWAVARLAPRWHLVARADRARMETTSGHTFDTFALAALSYALHDRIRVMPNLRYQERSADADPDLQARLTVELNF